MNARIRSAPTAGRSRWLLAVGVLVLAAADREPRSPVAATGRAVQELKREVRISDERPPRSEADFFRTYALETDAVAATTRLRRPQDSDPRADAYVRWQLTAIAEPDALPNDRNWDRLLRSLPALPQNPLAEERAIRQLEAEAHRERRTAESIERAMMQWTALEGRFEDVEPWARPGRALRRWLVDHAPDDGARLDAMLEWVHAEVMAGWHPREAIGRMDELCAAIGDRRGLEASAIDAFGTRARPLLKTRRSLIEGAWGNQQERTFGVEVTFIAIEDYDLNRWIKRLRFGSPPE